ncbi:MAG TPA: VOC family protein [Rhizomicrobium sp.]|jgi:catechol 2,3-dioxygenase-like lactoylglutathione lyase family enzyme
MIDHISLSVHDLETSAAFYDRVLAPLGLNRIVARAGSVGYGKTYPELWLNMRVQREPEPAGTGTHVALRAPSEDAVRQFHAAALAHGGRDDGQPGPRAAAMTAYFGAFILDPDGNKIEALNFPP